VRPMTAERDLDVVLYGATGFVGRLTARYLAQHAPEGVRIGLGGRSEPKLAQLRSELGPRAADWPLLVADSQDPAALAAMAQRARAVATTVGPYQRHGEPLVTACAKAGTDYVDLYQIHRFDYDTPIEETLEALHDIVKAGKARYIGASSMHAWQFATMLHAAEARGWTRFVSMQNHYNLVYREEEREMMPLCRAEGVGVIPWSPLARGFLAGNRRSTRGGETVRAKTDDIAHDYYGESDLEIADRTADLAKRRGVTPAQVALAWLLAKPGVTSPIVGASKLTQLDDAVAAIELRLDAVEMTFLEELYQPHRIIGHS